MPRVVELRAQLRERLIEQLRSVLADPAASWQRKRSAIARAAATLEMRSDARDLLRQQQTLRRAQSLLLAGQLDAAEQLMAEPMVASHGQIAAFLAAHDDAALRALAEQLCPGALLPDDDPLQGN
jgi:hypothetical protein